MKSREYNRIAPSFRQIVDKYLKEVPVRLGALANDLGLTVKLSTLNPGVSGKIYRDNNHYTIKINRHESRERQRFTLAHEISHFLLHRSIIDELGDGITDNVLYRSGAPESIEFEANRLAADLVMPKDYLFRRLEDIGGLVSEENIDSLAREFQVSKAAMENQLSPLAA